jgi:hypothetical protein
MVHRLPPDLERLGDQLVAGAERAVATERRRTRLARLTATGVAAAAAIGALAPAALNPSERAAVHGRALLARAALVPAYSSPCDQPRGNRFTLPDWCRAQPPITVGHPRRW